MSAMSVFIDNAVHCDFETVGSIVELYILKNDVDDI
jgi:hypothetical protein